MDGKTKQRSAIEHQLAWWVFKYYGLELQEDDTVTTPEGRKKGRLINMSFVDDVMTVHYQPLEALTFIPISVTIKGKEDNGA